MATATPSTPSARSWTMTAIIVLLLPQLVGILGLFPLYAFNHDGTDLQILAIALALFTLMTLGGLWWHKPWALWALLVVVSFQATIDLCALARHIDEPLAMVSLILLAAPTALAFREGNPGSPQISPYQRILFGFVFLFAAWVAAWGLFLPRQIGTALPLAVAPLHARFLGAMYLSGSVFMLLGMIARTWSDVRVVTLVLGLWTGMLGFVSAIHLGAFDWLRRPTWFWFVAYIAYPVIALWIAWCQRTQREAGSGTVLSRPLRTYLNVQGAVMLVLAFCLLVAPGFMTTVWPWAIPVLVAQIYGAPFLSYGLGSLYAARQRTWREARIVIFGTLVFMLGVLAASTLHSNLFSAHAPSSWLWFGGFAMASAALLVFSVTRSFGGGAGAERA